MILSNSAQKFIGKATFEAITHNKAILGLWDNNTNLNIDHVALANEADIIVISPATANTIGKLALNKYNKIHNGLHFLLTNSFPCLSLYPVSYRLSYT